MTRCTGGVSLRAAGEKEAHAGKVGIGGIIPCVVPTVRLALTQLPTVSLLQGVGIRYDMIFLLNFTSLHIAAETGARSADTVWRLRGEAEVGVEITVVVMLRVVLRGPGPALTSHCDLADSLALIVVQHWSDLIHQGEVPPAGVDLVTGGEIRTLHSHQNTAKYKYWK